MAKKAKGDSVFAERTITNIMKAEFAGQMVVADTKPHYRLLDGLRGVAALLVVWYHVHEGFSFAGGGMITGINHGYLAVDFFFFLSGFVISYAYDDRWTKGFSLKDFFKRRIIRLHPMVIIGAIIGAITFMLQGSVQWDGTHIATSAVMLAKLCAMFMIPATPGLLRMLFPFTAGMLVARNFRAINVRGAFWLCSAVLFALFCVPYLPQTFKVNDTLALTLNGAFESFCIVIVFPILVWLGASGRASDGVFDKVCGFLGDISYPLYVIHYPFMYLFYSWLIKTEQYTLMETWSVVLVLYASCVLVAFICLRLYDIPVRNWLRRRMG